MNLLALDTSTPRAAVALRRDGGPPRVAATDPSQRHGRELVPAIRDLLRSEGLEVGDLSAIGVGLGPGSYTGLRVGITAAKLLAYASRVRLVGLDSPEFSARAAPASALRVVALSDAQRGDFHVSDFARESPGAPLVRLGPTRIEDAASVYVAGDAAIPTVAVGPGVERWSGAWPPGVEPIRDDAPDPAILLEMLAEAVARGRSDDPWTLEPIYLRRSAAEDQWVAKKKAAP